MSTDVVFFYCSTCTLDKGNIYELLEHFIELKYEVHFFTFENPFDLLHVKINLKII